MNAKKGISYETESSQMQEIVNKGKEAGEPVTSLTFSLNLPLKLSCGTVYIHVYSSILFSFFMIFIFFNFRKC